MPPLGAARRPSPEALLEEANREHRGRLKIFLGAAPGVGKTYAMLQDAHARKRDGVDVVVGVVETHGRSETAALLDGLEVQPLRAQAYRERSFLEMDLDALLQRRPGLVLVDELAHTNVPGSRHLKRWQDVDELLEAGLDVYSTLNIQHLESLNDVVERIAGITVRETLPDSVLHKADDIELIDLPPQALIQRLNEGKVYVPEQAQRALHHFFSQGTLTALREMALRQAAERVDAQMMRYMRTHAIAGPWPTRERLLVGVGRGASALRLVRAAKRAAERRGAPWIALHVETPAEAGLSEEDKDGLSAALRLAEQLGGESAVVQGERVAEEILAVARERNVSQIIVGQSRRRPHRRVPRLPAELLRRGEGIDILVVAGEPRVEGRDRAWRLPRRREGWRGYAFAFLVVALITALGLVIDLWVPVPGLSMAYLAGVLLVAMRYRLGPSIFASLLGVVALDFCFTAPHFTLRIHDAHNIATVVFFLVLSILTSNIAARVRDQMDMTRTGNRRMTNLYDFNRRIAGAAGLDDVLWAVVHHVAATIGGQSLVLMPQGETLGVMAGYPPEDSLDEKSQAAARWAWEHGSPAGRGSATLPAADWLFLPMRTGRGLVGVLGVRLGEDEALISPEQSRLVGTLADQGAVAIERTTLAADIEKARVDAETERLRTALLSSLSHDLRTPLVSILGAASSLHAYEETLKPAQRLDLVQTIQEEAERLNRFVQNLLDMTRIGAGALTPKTDWVDLADVVGAATGRAKRMLRHRPLRLDLDPDLPLLALDPILLEQVFFNLIDNACKYSPDGSAVTIWARRRDRHVVIEVCDLGPGIPERDRERVFDMFYRVQAGDGQTAGTGLGLAICRGIIEAHGGTISAQSGINDAGTCIVITVPVGDAPDLPDQGEADAQDSGD
ncbi:sensor histidine kinase [Pararhodospirillum photometricum]|nr:sensor histidine kinase KdpD [Pararhodospirillum photometricum]